MPFERGRSGNPAGGPVGPRHRQQLNGEFIAALLRDFRHGGPKAIERVRRTQPAAYLKILTLLCPREHKVEHRNLIKELSDEELGAMIEYIKTALESAGRRSENDRGDDRTYNSTGYRSPGARASQAQAEPADDGGRYCDRATGAQAEEARAIAC